VVRAAATLRTAATATPRSGSCVSLPSKGFSAPLTVAATAPRPRCPAPGRPHRRDQGAGLIPVQADRVPRRPRRTPNLDLPGDPAGSAEGFAAADFGRGPALPNRLSQAPSHQPTDARFCR
jgi:hypothetical protein